MARHTIWLMSVSKQRAWGPAPLDGVADPLFHNLPHGLARCRCNGTSVRAVIRWKKKWPLASRISRSLKVIKI